MSSQGALRLAGDLRGAARIGTSKPGLFGTWAAIALGEAGTAVTVADAKSRRGSAALRSLTGAAVSGREAA
jgi:hypothetical protein